MGQLDLNFFDHLISFVLIIALPAAAVMSPQKPFDEIEMTPSLKKSLYLNNALIQWIGVAIVLILWYFSGRTWGVLGFSPVTPQAHPLWIVLFISFIVLYISNTIYSLFWPGQRERTLQRWRELVPFIPVTWADMRWWSIASLTAGICEEIIFRGYLINYLLSLLDGSATALFFSLSLPAVSFGLAHVYQGPKAVVKIFLMAFTFGLIFILTESLYYLIFAHVALDVIIGAVGVYATDRGKLLKNGRQAD